jgi:hypothetical protein
LACLSFFTTTRLHLYDLSISGGLSPPQAEDKKLMKEIVNQFGVATGINELLKKWQNYPNQIISNNIFLIKCFTNAETFSQNFAPFL